MASPAPRDPRPALLTALLACLLFAQWLIVPESYQYPGEPTAVVVGTREIAWLTCVSEDGCRVLVAPHWEYGWLEHGECCEHCHPDKGLFAGGDGCVVVTPITPEVVRYGTPEDSH